MKRKMMKTRSRLLILCMAVTLALVLAPAAGAAPQEPASGVWTWYSGGFDTARPAADNLVFTGWELGLWTGTFQGSSFEPYKGTVHGKGSLNAEIWAELEGTVGDKSGTLVIKLTVLALPDKVMDGQWVILGGTDGMAKAQGQGGWRYAGDTTVVDADGVEWPASFADYWGKISVK